MRFATVLAAVAALWVQPAGAVEYVFDFEAASGPLPYATEFQSGPVTLRLYDPTVLGAADSFNGTNAIGTRFPEFQLVIDPYLFPNAFLTSLSFDIANYLNTDGGGSVRVAYYPTPGAPLEQGPVAIPAGLQSLTFSMTTPASPTYLAYISCSTCGGANRSFQIDNVRVGVFQGVPEPATWALLMLGIGLTGIGLRRRHGYTSPVFQQPFGSSGPS